MIHQVIHDMLRSIPLCIIQMAKTKAPNLGSAENSQAWIDGPNSYKLGLQNGKVVCLNAKGNQLATLPAVLKEDPITDQLQALATWLDDHSMECLHTVERWMLRSLIVPRQTLIEVWPDLDWRTALENLIIAPATSSGKVDFEQFGMLKSADVVKGVGVIDVDGESKWLKSPCVTVLHPILIGELDDLRDLANDLGVVQSVEQLYRPVFRPAKEQLQLNSVRDYENGEFVQLNFALGVCKRLGYPVRGGYATCKVWEGASPLEARYYVGSESPESPTFTGDLIFVDDKQQAIPIRDVGPVTFSEGVRMASSIYAKRKVEKSEGAES